MSHSDDPDDEDATRMMSRGPEFAGGAKGARPQLPAAGRPAAPMLAAANPEVEEADDEPDPDATVPMTRGAAFAQFALQAKSQSGSAQQASLLPHHASRTGSKPPDSEMTDTGEMTLPRNRNDLPLRTEKRPLGDTGEVTLPRTKLAPEPPLPLPPRAYQQPSAPPPNRGSVPPPSSHRPQASSMPMIPNLPGLPSMPVYSNMPVPQNMPVQTYRPPAHSHPPSERAVQRGSVPPPSRPIKVRSPTLFVGVMVSCTVLTMTGLALLVYLKMKGLW